MRRHFRPLEVWFDEHRILGAVTLSSVALATIAWATFLLGNEAALRALLVLPLWLATRLGGRPSGLILVGFTGAVGAWLDCGPLGTRNDPLWACATLHVAVLGALMLAIAKLEESLWTARKQAMRDPLTGLLNRRALADFGGDALARSSQSQEPLAIVVLDCDDFKALNDAFGHAAGDQVLRILARVMEVETRHTDLVARLGGDEFALVLPGSDTDEASAVLGRIERSFVGRVADAGYATGLSFGMATLQEDVTDIGTLLRSADAAMYATKSARKRRAFLN